MKRDRREDKNINYKMMIDDYYDRDYHLQDIKQEISTITPHINILNSLVEFDKYIDALIKTKKYDIQEIFMKPSYKVKRILRIKLKRNIQQNLFKIWGQLSPHQQNAPLFTAFFKSIKISIGNDPHTTELWKKPISHNFQDKNGLLMKLPKNQQENIVVSLNMISNPPKFEVDPLLERIVGFKVGTRVQVLQAVWNYIKEKNLQDPESKQIINTDDNLKQIFNKAEKVNFASINNKVRDYLTILDIVNLELGEKLTKKAYDLVVEVEQKPNVDIVPFFSQKLNEEKNDHPFLSLNSKIKKYEKKFHQNTEKLRRHLKKRQIYKNFQPQTIEKIIEEQHSYLRELKRIKNSEPTENYHRLEYLLDNEDEMDKQIKHYYELNSMASKQQQ